MSSCTRSGSGCLLTPADDLAKQTSYKAGSVKWAAHLPLLGCAHTIAFPLATRGSWEICLVSWPQSKISLKAGGWRALVIHILASVTADVAFIATPSIELCLACRSTDKNRERSNFPIKMHNPEGTPASKELQAEGLKATRDNFIQDTAYCILIIRYLYTVSYWLCN